jgi:hypothetical protein
VQGGATLWWWGRALAPARSPRSGA